MAINGQDAIKHLEVVRPDLILTDYMMPLMNGGEMAKHIRASGDKVPIVMTSATEIRMRPAKSS